MRAAGRGPVGGGEETEEAGPPPPPPEVLPLALALGRFVLRGEEVEVVFVVVTEAEDGPGGLGGRVEVAMFTVALDDQS